MTFPQSPGGQPSVPVCYRHPGRETYLRCTRCDRPICPECMIPASVGHQCPECVADGRKTQREHRTQFGGSVAGTQGIVTKVLIGLNVAVFLLGIALEGDIGALTRGGGWLPAYGAVHGPDTFDAGGVQVLLPVPGIDGGGFHRLFTAMFIHYGVLHLLLNMYALWILGRSLEAVLGPVRFAALYLIAGFGGNVACYLFSPDAFSAGASTSIFGLFAAYFFVLRRLGRDVMSIVPIIGINLVFTFLIPNISIAGHIGGLVTGAICGLGLAYAPKENRALVQGLVLGGTFVALVALTLATSMSR